MDENKSPLRGMSTWESVFAIGWLPIHILGLPLLLLLLFRGMSGANVNFWVYTVGALVLSLLCIRFLIRDLRRFLRAPMLLLGQAILGFLLLLAANLVVTVVLAPLFPESNPNNEALVELAGQERLRITLITVLMAPLLEELMFRGGVFGLLRRWSRPAAYEVCVLLFAVYHTWQYALLDPAYWLYLIQYLPAGILLCLIYDKTDCIWASILLHVINNGVSLAALQFVGG